MLDIKTIYAIMSLSSLLMAFTLWLSSVPRFQDGLSKWCLALILQSITWGLYGTFDTTSYLIHNIAADLILAISWALKLLSLLEFRHIASNKIKLTGYISISCLLFLGMALLHPTAATDSLRAVLFAWITFELGLTVSHIQDLPSSRVRLLMASVYFLLSFGFFWKAYRIISGIDFESTQNQTQVIIILIGYSFILLSTFCMLLMHKERSDHSNYLLAVTDPLTGIYNRRKFTEHLEKALVYASQTGKNTSIIMVDIDHFKKVNDDYGHLIGDEVIKAIVEKIKSCLRKQDILMRFGGEEFFALLPGEEKQNAMFVADRIRDCIAQKPIRLNGLSIPITVSIGVSTASRDAVETQETKEALFHTADKALHQAKNAGRNRVVAIDVIGSTCGPLPHNKHHPVPAR